MKRKLIALVLTLCLTFGMAAPAAAYTPDEQAIILEGVLDFIQDASYDLPDEARDDLLMKALKAMFTRTEGAYDIFMDALLSLFDSHSMYLPAGYYDNAFASGGTTAYVGVGITMQLDPQGVLVTELAKDGPAAEAGVQVGDLVTHADGVKLAGMTLEQIRSHIIGEAGTSVTLTVQRALRSLDITVTRRVVYQRTFDAYALEDGIYYMDYNNFSDTSDYLSFVFSIREMVQHETKVLILDLRDNPGGVLNYGLSLLNRLIPDADVEFFGIETQQEGELVTDWYTSDGMGPRLNKIIILQNEGSASAAEVVSSSLHDLGYAVTVGGNTHGKARMQNHLVFTDGSAVVLTTGRLVPPSLLDFEGIGLAPDWLVSNEAPLHPAASCALLTNTKIPMNDFSPNGKRLNEALIALGYLDKNDLEKGTGWVGAATMAALRLFQDDYRLIHRAYPDAASVQKINEVLTALQQTPSQSRDLQLDKALEIARSYLDQPMQYTVDQFGNFRNK